MKTYDINGITVTVKDFVPREFKESDCRCENKTTAMKAGRIEHTKCNDCGNEVWS